MTSLSFLHELRAIQKLFSVSIVTILIFFYQQDLFILQKLKTEGKQF